LLIAITAACFNLVGVAGIAPFLATLADATLIDRNPILAWLHQAFAFRSSGDFVMWLGIGFVALLVLANVANLLAILAIGRFSQRVGARFHVLLFEEYLHRDLSFHARSNSDVLATHVVFEINRIVGGVIQNGLTLIASAVSIGLIAGAVIFVDPVIALGAALSLGLTYAAIYALVRRRLVRDGTSIACLWNMRARVIAEGLEAIKDVIIFHAQREMAAQVARQSDAIAAAQARNAAIAISPKYLLECVTAAGLVAAALWIYRSVGPGQWLTQLAFLGFAAYRLLPPVQQLFTGIARIRSDGVGFDRIADDLARARQRTVHAPDAANGEWAARPLREIRLTGVSYRHSPERAGGVTDVSLRIPAGALIGLAGPNGSGKTTLANLILGVLVPDAGQIEIDGVPIDDRNRGLWLTAVAHVPQHIVLLDATLAQNVAFGAPPEHIDVERVRKALRDARLASFVDAIPEGAATIIGQNGLQLSGGQRQRVGIARALHRRASLLVMDEATNALDSATEAEVIALLGTLRGKCTTILIAHRPSALRACDVLFELDGGRLVVCRNLTAPIHVSQSIQETAPP
jgi:HlyD family secretion protein